jgi:hypothetical protein
MNEVGATGYDNNGASHIYFPSQTEYITGLTSESYLSQTPEKRHGSFGLTPSFLDGDGSTPGDLMFRQVLANWEMPSPMDSGVGHGGAHR